MSTIQELFAPQFIKDGHLTDDIQARMAAQLGADSLRYLPVESIAFGSTIDEAVDRLELLEVLCRAWWDARMLGWAPTPALSKSGSQY